MIEITYTCDFCNNVIENWCGKVNHSFPTVLKDLDRYDACVDCLRKARRKLEDEIFPEDKTPNP